LFFKTDFIFESSITDAGATHKGQKNKMAKIVNQAAQAAKEVKQN
jgi:hypothetical protein